MQTKYHLGKTLPPGIHLKGNQYYVGYPNTFCIPPDVTDYKSYFWNKFENWEWTQHELEELKGKEFLCNCSLPPKGQHYRQCAVPYLTAYFQGPVFRGPELSAVSTSATDGNLTSNIPTSEELPDGPTLPPEKSTSISNNSGTK